jgi:ABC-type branched-chain amino acid transport systems, periplasmic component
MKPVKLTACLAAGLLGLAACGGPGGGAGEDEEITIGVIADLTGATADVGKPYNEGMLAYVDKLNSDGGIEGRKIKALSEDYAYDVPTAEEKYKKYVSQGAVAIQGWGTGDSEALRKKVSEDELPFMSASYAEPLTEPKESPYNFVVAPTYSDQMRIALDHIAPRTRARRWRSSTTTRRSAPPRSKTARRGSARRATSSATSRTP